MRERYSVPQGMKRASIRRSRLSLVRTGMVNFGAGMWEHVAGRTVIPIFNIRMDSQKGCPLRRF